MNLALVTVASVVLGVVPGVGYVYPPVLLFHLLSHFNSQCKLTFLYERVQP